MYNERWWYSFFRDSNSLMQIDASSKRTQRSASEALAAVDHNFRLLALAIS